TNFLRSCKVRSTIFTMWFAGKEGHYAVLIGDIRKNGEFFSPQATVATMAPGKLQSVVIKYQHNCFSDKIQYSGKFIPILHEYMLLFRKPGMMLSFVDCGLETTKSLVGLSHITGNLLLLGD